MEDNPKQAENPLNKAIDDAIDDLRESAQEATVAPPVARYRARIAQYTFNLLLFSFFLFALAAHVDNYFRWDVVISHTVQSISLPAFSQLMQIISMPGNNLFAAVGLVFIAFIFLWLLRYRLEAYTLL